MHLFSLCHRDLEDNSANPMVCNVDDFLDRSTNLPYLLYKFWNATPNAEVNSFCGNKRCCVTFEGSQQVRHGAHKSSQRSRRVDGLRGQDDHVTLAWNEI